LSFDLFFDVLTPDCTIAALKLSLFVISGDTLFSGIIPFPSVALFSTHHANDLFPTLRILGITQDGIYRRPGGRYRPIQEKASMWRVDLARRANWCRYRRYLHNLSSAHFFTPRQVSPFSKKDCVTRYWSEDEWL